MWQGKKDDHLQIKPYTYIITRRDLPISVLTVQSIHASIEATKRFPQPSETVFVVLCSVKNEIKLRNSLDFIRSRGIKCASFEEPDLDNQLTAIATEPVYQDKRHIFRKFQILKGETNES